MTQKKNKAAGISGLDAIEAILPDLIRSGPRQRILAALIDVGEEGLSFRSLSRTCRLRPTSLAYHLKVLVSRGGIRKEFRYQEIEREFSFYMLTDTGRSAVSASMDLLDLDMGNGATEMEEVMIIRQTAAPRLLLIKG
ncbi:MAG: helix-turn-helix transcriptional regulator [Thermoplasmata archaeon]|nr:helix-turn-helix transcriptional regulator [Thermoplasmata archaeon]